MKIAIITDGNNTLGMGHVYQSIVLAGLLLQKNISVNNIIFLTKSKENVLNLIRESGFMVNQYSDDDEIFNALSNENPDRIIFDKLDVSPMLALRIKKNLTGVLIIFTNLTKANEYADITVLARIGSNYKNVVNKDDITKIEYVGPKFWLLRPEFYILKEKKKVLNDEIKEIMLIFGGSDPANLSSAVLNELLQLDSCFNILLVLGNAFEHNQELNAVVDKNKSSGSKLTIVKNITNVGESMYKSDIVITSPGLSFFEALAIGIPVIVFHQNEQHMNEFDDIIPTLSIAEVHNLRSIINNKSFLYPDDPIIASLEIGDGKDEIINEILK
jgi:spore coat polysaccharide biosynthesis predicted glycosyltransferase SpsG